MATQYITDISWAAAPDPEGRPLPLGVPLPPYESASDFLAAHWGAANAYALLEGPLEEGEYFKVCGPDPSVYPIRDMGVIYGYWPLSNEGARQAEALAKRMAAHGIPAQIFECKRVWQARPWREYAARKPEGGAA